MAPPKLFVPLLASPRHRVYGPANRAAWPALRVRVEPPLACGLPPSQSASSTRLGWIPKMVVTCSVAHARWLRFVYMPDEAHTNPLSCICTSLMTVAR